MKKIVITLTMLFACLSTAHAEMNLSNWKKLGLGNVAIQDNATFTLNVPSLANSKGLIFLSDEPLPDSYRLSFDFKTSNPGGVLVMLLAFSSIEGGEVVAAGDYDGNWAYFRDGVDHAAYAVALHTKAHQPNTFIRKIPGFDLLAQTHDPYASGPWNHLTIEKNGADIKLIRDNNILLLEVVDYDGEPLGAGYLGFRLSPAENQLFTVEYRNVSIETL